MHSDRNAKAPGSMAWQSEHLLICSDDHIVRLPSPSGSAPLRFSQTDIPRASTNCTSPNQSAPHTSASPNHGVLHTGSTFLGVTHTMFTGAPPTTSQQGIPLLTTFVVKGERGHPTRTLTRVYRVPNMRSDRHTKEPGSMAWQPESIFNRRDDHIVTLPSPSGSAPMRYTHTGIPHAYTNHASPIQSSPHTRAAYTQKGSFTRGQHSWGSLTQFMGGV